MMKPYFRRLIHGSIGAMAAGSTFTGASIAPYYKFPVVGSGQDVAIAICELGGGYKMEDIQSYMSGLGLPVPKITDVSVRGAVNSPGDPGGADGEVMLDILVAAAAYSKCTGKAANLLLVFAPNDANGMADATEAARTHPSKPCAISWSWGGPEDSWDVSSISAMEASLQLCQVAGIIVTAAAGDNGSGDGESGNRVDYPASSQYVMGCGGTSLRVSGGQIVSETVWNDGASRGSTGGGVSALFPLPDYQKSVVASGEKGRGVPDWAANSDPETGYEIIVDGKRGVIGGTSAAAPLLAALVGVMCSGLKRNIGPDFHATLYANPKLCRDITQGNNGGFPAGPGYDNDTGLGVPIGVDVLSALNGVQPPPPPPPPPPPVKPPPPPHPCPNAIPAVRLAVRVIRAIGEEFPGLAGGLDI